MLIDDLVRLEPSKGGKGTQLRQRRKIYQTACIASRDGGADTISKQGMSTLSLGRLINDRVVN